MQAIILVLNKILERGGKKQIRPKVCIPIICAQPQNFNHMPELITLYMNNTALHYKGHNYYTVFVPQSCNS